MSFPLRAFRQFVGGTTKEGGWFGNMRGAGYFKQRLNNDPTSLDAALDRIPLRGKVKKADFDSFTAAYKWERAGTGTASRLLAMKRPQSVIINIDVSPQSRDRLQCC
jgi:hypothetical protein